MFLDIRSGVKILSDTAAAEKATKVNIMWAGITCFLGIVLTIALNRTSEAWAEQIRIQKATFQQVMEISIQMKSADFQTMRGDITANQYNFKMLQQELERVKNELNLQKNIYK